MLRMRRRRREKSARKKHAIRMPRADLALPTGGGCDFWPLGVITLILVFVCARVCQQGDDGEMLNGV